MTGLMHDGGGWDRLASAPEWGEIMSFVQHSPGGGWFC